MKAYLPFLVVLLAVALATKADYFFYLLYALFGIVVLGRFWAGRSLAGVTITRRHDARLFLGQTAEVELQVANTSWLPVLWVRVQDTVPSDLTTPGSLRWVVSLRPHERLRLHYPLTGRRRGYYQLGPAGTLGGDLLGLAEHEGRQQAGEFVIVYPKIVSLRELGFPSQSPFGTLPSRQRIFEDPTRIQGVRPYQAGDSLRRMDWKTSARVGALQVRRYEPAIALETALFLNLCTDDYPTRERFQAPELAIVIAASLANHLVQQRQAVALFTNGRDPLEPVGADGTATPAGGWNGAGEERGNGREPRAVPPGRATADTPALPLRKGREHLMHLLDLLARVEAQPDDEGVPFLELLRRKSLGLPWGSTVVAITSHEMKGLMDTLLALRRRGLIVVLVLTSAHRGFTHTAQRAEQIGVQALEVRSEREMDVWR
jgi:uncharacterized protein (DUF58 family)